MASETVLTCEELVDFIEHRMRMLTSISRCSFALWLMPVELRHCDRWLWHSSIGTRARFATTKSE